MLMFRLSALSLVVTTTVNLSLPSLAMTSEEMPSKVVNPVGHGKGSYIAQAAAPKIYNNDNTTRVEFAAGGLCK